MTEPRFSLIVPAHNEGARIGGSIAAYADAFADSEVLVVLNGCTDDTESAARRAVGGRGNLRFIRVEHAVGKGGAVRAGFLSARAQVVGYVDADGSTPADEMRRLFELVGNGTDAVIASRWSRGADVVVAQALLRRVSSRVFNAIVRVLFGLPYNDTQCGAKAFSSEAIREISESLETSNFGFDIDVLHGLRRTGRTILEVPTKWRDVSGSRIQLARASRMMLIEILRLRLRYSLFRYVVPIFDRIWPTRPLRVRHGLAILFLNWRDPKHPDAGGAERYLLEIGRRLVARGNRVHWLTAGFPGAAKTDEIDGISITRVGNKIAVYAAIPLTYLRDFRDRFDVIVDAENGIPFFSPLYSLKPKICLIFHVHQRVFEKHLSRPLAILLKWVEAKFMPWLYGKSRFAVISEDTRTELCELGVPVDIIDLAQCGVDETLRPAAKSERPTIVYVGRIKAYKRVDLLVQAMPEILSRVPDAELVIAGTGDQEDTVRELAQRLGVAGSVRFEGFVDEDDKRQLFASAWVFAMPSEMEGWGMTVIEANACATPAVAFAVPGLREAIVDGQSGLLVRDGDPIAPTLTRILTDTPLRTRLSAGALVRARDFSWDRATDALLDSMFVEISRQHASYVRTGDAWAVVPHIPSGTDRSPLTEREQRAESLI